MGNTFVDQLTVHVVVPGPPESAFGAEPSAPFIGPVPPLPPDEDVPPLVLPPPLPLELPVEPDVPPPDEEPEPDDEGGVPAGSGGVTCDSPFGGP
jgi:hypothetical protein